jgi:hypothetical protein
MLRRSCAFYPRAQPLRKRVKPDLETIVKLPTQLEGQDLQSMKQAGWSETQLSRLEDRLKVDQVTSMKELAEEEVKAAKLQFEARLRENKERAEEQVKVAKMQCDLRLKEKEEWAQMQVKTAELQCEARLKDNREWAEKQVKAAEMQYGLRLKDCKEWAEDKVKTSEEWAEKQLKVAEARFNDRLRDKEEWAKRQLAKANYQIAKLDANLRLYQGTLTRCYLLEMALRLSWPCGKENEFNSMEAAMKLEENAAKEAPDSPAAILLQVAKDHLGKSLKEGRTLGDAITELLDPAPAPPYAQLLEITKASLLTKPDGLTEEKHAFYVSLARKVFMMTGSWRLC